ncbi:hypothetical protein CR513_52843, partial [Mucuna pruriens]
MKKLEVADLFDIKQNKSETLKSYLAWFNNAKVRINNPDQKFFVKAFQKGLRARQFSNSLVLRKPQSMEEIRIRAEKLIEVEEDQVDRIEAKKKTGSEARPTPKGENTPPDKETTPPSVDPHVREEGTNTPRNSPHQYAEVPEGHEGLTDGTKHARMVRYVWKESEKKNISSRAAKKANEREKPRETKEDLRGEKQRERSRSLQRRDIWRRGVITTISGGGDILGVERG